jgi:hypothetical protein
MIPANTKGKEHNFYGNYLEFIRLSRLEDKSHIIKIQPKFTFVNNSNELIEIRGNDSSIYVMPYQMGELSKKVQKDNSVTVIFGKYHEREISLLQYGVNYLQMEDIFFKVSVIKK